MNQVLQDLSGVDSESGAFYSNITVVPYTKQMNIPNRSKQGQGSENVTITETDNEDFYIPPNGNCFFACILKALETSPSIIEQLKQKIADFIKEKKKKKGVVPCCKIFNFVKFVYEQSQGTIKLNISLFDNDSLKSQGWQCHRSNALYRNLLANEPKIVLYLLQSDHDKLVGHFVLIKNDIPKTAVDHIEKNKELYVYCKTWMNVSTSQQIKPVTIKLGQAVIPTYIWDCEADRDETNIFQVYAIGIMSVDMTGSVDQIKQENVTILRGRGCFDEMIEMIDNNHQKPVDSKGHVQRNRVKVDCWAHNSKGFDSYLLLTQLKRYKFKNVVKSGQGLL